jgi:hypothetical protein
MEKLFYRLLIPNYNTSLKVLIIRIVIIYRKEKRKRKGAFYIFLEKRKY